MDNNTQTNAQNTQPNKPKKSPGRPRNESFNEKELLERRLKAIWSKVKGNKASEVISAASLYAELKGWKLKKPDMSENGEVLKIEFAKDESMVVKSITKPPEKKIIESAPITKEVVVEPAPITTTTTTMPEQPKVEIEFK